MPAGDLQQRAPTKARRPRERAAIAPLLRDLKARLKRLYGKRLARLVLYGSFARSEATAASDVDVLAVLEGVVHERKEIKRTSADLYALQLKYGELIALLPISREDYEQRRTPLLVNVRREEQVI